MAEVDGVVDVMVVEYLMDHLKGAALEQLLRLLRDGEAHLLGKDCATSILARMQAKMDSMDELQAKSATRQELEAMRAELR